MSAAMAIPPKYPPELDALPPKRRAFVLAYVGEAAGNATAAARIAGYKACRAEGSRLLTFADVRDAIEALGGTARLIASAQELREMWTRWARGEDPGFGPKERVKASELLGKSQAMFVERREHIGAPLVANQIAVQIVASDDEADHFLAGKKRSE